MDRTPFRIWTSCVHLLDQHTIFLGVLQLLWICIVLRYELGVFSDVLWDCKWPLPSEIEGSIPRTSHVLLVADPQILNANSYPSRPQWLVSLTQFIVDLNLRKSWRLVVRKLAPRAHAVIFLGDMMDGGRDDMSDRDYENYHTRFNDIFTNHESPSPVYHIPGNHDTGLGDSSSFSSQADKRYLTHFAHSRWGNSGLNYHISIANHTLVFIDAPGLVEEDRERERYGHRYGSTGWTPVPGGAIDFVKKFAAGKHDPTVLMTHIPLSRPAGTPCGPLREKGVIRPGAGHGYENTLSEEATIFLLSSVKPVTIFSGDDHDYCVVAHTIPNSHATAPEISVKSFSMAMGIRRPGFQLLSLVSPSANHPARQLHTPCLLPDQLGIYMWMYLPLVVLSILGILVANVHRIRHRGNGEGRPRAYSQVTRSTRRSVTPEPGCVGQVLMIERGRSGSMQAKGESGECRVRDGLTVDANGYGNGKANGKAKEHKEDSLHILPMPTNSLHRQRRHRRFSWTFILKGTRRRISIPRLAVPTYLWLFARSGDGCPMHVQLVYSCIRDVGVVAWPPLAVAGVVWWIIFHS